MAISIKSAPSTAIALTGKDSALQKVEFSLPDRAWWAVNGSNNPKLVSTMYSIGIWDLLRNEFISYAGVNPATEGAESKILYEFTVPPQQYELNEAAATIITPTQDGGKFIESQGCIFKDIRLTGTVGFRPNVPTREIVPGLAGVTGVSLTRPNFLDKEPSKKRGISDAEITGFDNIIFLRNIFRLYWQLKTDVAYAQNCVLVYIYKKENEAYIVEPMNFTTSRDKGNPLGWNYNITLRTLAKLDTNYQFEQDEVGMLQKISNGVNKARDFLRQMTTSIYQVSGAINYVVALPKNLVDEAITAMASIANAMVSVINAGASFSSWGSGFFDNAGDRIQALQDELYAKLGTQTPSGISNSYNSAEGTVLEAIKTANRAVRQMQIMDGMFQDRKNYNLATMKRAYNDKFNEPPSTSGSKTNINNISIPTRGDEVVVGTGDTVRTIAKKYLGDEAQWKTIVILNNLNYPYISTGGEPSTVAPGDKLLIPRYSASTMERSLVGRNLDNTNTIEINYGRDLLLQASTEGYDLCTEADGDLKLVEGAPNVEQAINIKLNTLRGELPMHPTFGAMFPIGTRVDLGLLHDFGLASRQTFLQDSRIEAIVDMKLYAEGDVIYNNTILKLAQTDDQLAVQFSVRS